MWVGGISGGVKISLSDELSWIAGLGDDMMEFIKIVSGKLLK